MAKKKTKKKSSKKREAIGPSYLLCIEGDEGCEAGKSLPRVGSVIRDDFTYTTPSAQVPRSAKDRRAYGCTEHDVKNPKTKEVKRKFTGRLGPDNAPGLPEGTPDTYCKTTSKPCGDRASCPVQLVWVKGQPNLRFCRDQGEPGWLVPVSSAREAQELAEQACKEWPRPKKKVPWPKDFFAKKAPFVKDTAERTYPKRGKQKKTASPWVQPGLGRVSRTSEPSWFQGEGGAWVTLMVPVGAMIGFMILQQRRNK